MRLERLNYNKIKIFLTFDDLSERGLTKRRFVEKCTESTAIIS